MQAVLPHAWLAFGVDSLVDAMPAKTRGPGDHQGGGIDFTSDGEVRVGADFRALEAAWMAGVVGMVRVGARVIVDDVFLGGTASQERWRTALGGADRVDGADVLWVGVRCDGAVAAGREIARGDRVRGMAAAQAEVVHEGVFYDLEVDTTRTESLACARAVAARVT